MAQIINYTTTIDVFKTVGEIQGILVGAGARRIMVDYEEQQPAGIKFEIPYKGKPLFVQMPARPRNVEKILKKMKQEKGSKMSVKPDYEQACRVAWRILKDWLEAQMSLIQTEQAEAAEIFLPYVTDASGKTVYEIAQTKILELSE